MGSQTPFGSLTVSALIHSSCVIALLVAPELVPLNLGTEPPTQIEFEALPSKGEPKAPLEKSEAEVTTAPVAVEKTAAAKPKPLPKATVEKAEPEVATVLPPKEVVEEPPVEDASDVVPVVAVAEPEEAEMAAFSDKMLDEAAVNEEPIEDTAINEQPIEENIEDATEAAGMNSNEEIEEEIATEVAAAEELQQEPAEEIVEETEATETVAEAPTEAPAEVQASSQTTEGPVPAVASKGVNQGVRSYESLSQIPGNIPPKYPSRARLNRQQGQVVLKYFVTQQGQVASLQLVRSSGFPLLDQEAVNSIRQFKYRPGQEGWTVHPVNFSLKGPEEKIGGRLRTSMR